MSIFGMVPETHGEICRLGYLKVVAALKESGLPNLTAISEKLLDFAKSLGGVRKSPKPTGLLTKSKQTAFYYAVLAKELGILDEYFSIISILPSYEKTKNLVQKFLSSGEASSSHKAIISLSSGEKIVLAYVLSRRDPLFIELMEWAKNTRKFRRIQAIKNGLSEIIPKVLPKAAEKTSRYSEELRTLKPTEAIRTRAYNSGRHLIPPRLEWAVDLNLLKRHVGGGKGTRVSYYEATPLLDEILMTLKRLREIAPDAPPDEDSISLFDQLITAYARVENRYRMATDNTIEKALKDAHKTLSKRSPVPMLTLLIAASTRLLEMGLVTTITDVKEVLMKIIFVNLAYYRSLPNGSIAIISLEPHQSTPPTIEL